MRCWRFVQQGLSKRCTKSKTRGRPATSAEVVVRMLLLKTRLPLALEPDTLTFLDLSRLGFRGETKVAKSESRNFAVCPNLIAHTPLNASYASYRSLIEQPHWSMMLPSRCCLWRQFIRHLEFNK